MSIPDTSPHRLLNRLLPRFSLRTMLVALTLLCLVLGLVVPTLLRMHRRDQARRIIESLNGGFASSTSTQPESALWQWLGYETLQDAESVTLYECEQVPWNQLQYADATELMIFDSEFLPDSLVPLPEVKDLVIAYGPEYENRLQPLKEYGFGKLFPNIERINLGGICFDS